MLGPRYLPTRTTAGAGRAAPPELLNYSHSFFDMFERITTRALFEPECTALSTDLATQRVVIACVEAALKLKVETDLGPRQPGAPPIIVIASSGLDLLKEPAMKQGLLERAHGSLPFMELLLSTFDGLMDDFLGLDKTEGTLHHT